jgi:hypothetical protein
MGLDMHRLKWNVLVLVAALAMGLSIEAVASAQTAQRGPAQKKLPEAEKLVMELRAMDLLKAMSERLAAAKTMSFTAIASYEYPSQLGPAIVYTTRYDVVMRRPDGLKVVMPGDGPASDFYYDGKTMIAYAPTENLVALADAPSKLDDALKQAFQTAAIYFPFTDLLLDDPYAALAERGRLAFYIGPSGMIGGTKTEMLAWADNDVFLQAWIGTEDKLPRRIRAVFSADPLRLRHDMELSNWQLDPAVPADTFTSARALEAPHIRFDHPAAKLPPGVKPLVAGKGLDGAANTAVKPQ